MSIRLDRLQHAPNKDHDRTAAITPFWRAYLERLQAHQRQGTQDPELEQFRWMLEELRVSIYAQELKTAMPISTKRLEKQWQKVRG